MGYYGYFYTMINIYIKVKENKKMYTQAKICIVCLKIEWIYIYIRFRSKKKDVTVNIEICFFR